MHFTDETCERLFGAEDAENEALDRFVEYFYRNRAYENLNLSLPIRILVGPKGVGKSALLRRLHINDQADGILSIWMQPKILRLSQSHNDFVENIEAWKTHLVDVLGNKALEHLLREPKETIIQNVPFAKNTKMWMDFFLNKVRDIAENKLGPRPN